MKLLTVENIRALDQCTLKKEGITSWQLMERASRVFVHWFSGRFKDEDIPIAIYTGLGNNGGDGLAIARLLHQRFYTVQVYVCAFSDQQSAEFASNLRLINKSQAPDVSFIQSQEAAQHLPPQSGVIIDALFGSGLDRPLEGEWRNLVEHINAAPVVRISVDVPSGMFSDKPTGEAVSILADYTLSFEMPKLGFFMSENAHRLGQWEFESIGLSKECWSNLSSHHHYLTTETAAHILQPRHKFDHKGDFGHVLLVMGSIGKIGAAVLSARACLRSGAGLVSIHAPQGGYEILQSSVPEAMVQRDEHQSCFSGITYNLSAYDTLGIGCGLGTNPLTQYAMDQLLEMADRPMVIDADALNILSMHSNWLDRVPKGSILTPHPGEFKRLFGGTDNNFEQLERLGQMARQYELYILLKGAHTVIATPDGQFYFNSSGNPGMATAGSGDVLTGILSGLLAQGYSPKQSILLGTYLHGLAGDLALEELRSEESLIASDIVDYLGAAFAKLHRLH